MNGLAQGVVVDAMDPLGKARVRVRIPFMAVDSSEWAPVSVPFGVAAQAAKPKVGDLVVVGFDGGDVRRPIVLGKIG